ncbi:MAG: hypothetical protein KC621_19055 [Myxococcales bacterium]|nr:hypothetical protein [Myxococcales bacterium]
MLWLAPAAIAAPSVDAVLFGAPFEAHSALGMTDPAHPSALSVLITGDSLTCDLAHALQAGGKAKKPKVVVVATFTDTTAGAGAAQWLIMGKKGLGSLTGTATLEALPTAVGDKGIVRFALKASEAGKDGVMGGMIASSPGDHLTGDLTFELCDAITPRPSLADTTFTETDVDIVEPSHFQDEPDHTLAVTMPLPQGWTAGRDGLGSPQWTAPDGVTVLSLSLATAFDPFEEGAADWVKSQVGSFQTEATTSELVSARAAGDGAYAGRWRYRWGEGPWTSEIDVFRAGEGWAWMVQCSVKSDDTGSAQVFDAAESACLALKAR